MHVCQTFNMLQNIFRHSNVNYCVSVLTCFRSECANGFIRTSGTAVSYSFNRWGDPGDRDDCRRDHHHH